MVGILLRPPERGNFLGSYFPENKAFSCSSTAEDVGRVYYGDLIWIADHGNKRPRGFVRLGRIHNAVEQYAKVGIKLLRHFVEDHVIVWTHGGTGSTGAQNPLCIAFCGFQSSRDRQHVVFLLVYDLEDHAIVCCHRVGFVGI